MQLFRAPTRISSPQSEEQLSLHQMKNSSTACLKPMQGGQQLLPGAILAAILSIGVEGYEKLRNQQEENRKFLESSLKEVAERHSQRILDVYHPISVAMRWREETQENRQSLYAQGLWCKGFRKK